MDLIPSPDRARDLIATFTLFIVVTVLTLMLTKRWAQVWEITRKDFSNRRNLILLLFCLAIAAWGLGSKHSPALRQASFAGLIALSIAWYAHVDLVFSSFLFTFLLTLNFSK